MSAEEVDFAIA